MFGFSIGKLLFLAGVIFVVCYGWKRVTAAGQALQKRARAATAPREQRAAAPETIDLVRDPKTGRYEPQKRD